MAKETRKFKLVEAVNELSLSSFVEAFAPKNALVAPSTPDLAKKPVQLSFESSASLSLETLEACFNLIEESSADHYRTGGVGWHPAHKKDEMKLPDLKYLLVKRKDPASGGKDGERVEGFISFMITYEDGKEVIYCYEIHLSPALRGSGVGKHLMSVFEEIGRNVGMEKTMLTVFKRNQDAVGFYDQLEYVVDEFTPQPKILRNGIVKESTYVVLSKQLRNGKDTEGTSKHDVDKDVD
jgi:N-alpha-acetyltransferase 40